jgi:hypothetical protein
MHSRTVTISPVWRFALAPIFLLPSTSSRAATKSHLTTNAECKEHYIEHSLYQKVQRWQQG